MNSRTVFNFLIGRRAAILDVLTCRNAVWIGGVFVLSAGFAREYDGEDLLAEPWHLLLPLGASLATSFVLFLLLEFAVRKQADERASFYDRYRAFLGLYWMTAPLAWLYAIPYERFLDAADAVRANLWTLAVVATWRVVLMTRVASVVYRMPKAAAFPIVMFFADTVALIVVYLTPMPIFNVMGGIRLTESEALIQSVQMRFGFLALGTWPIWLIGTLLHSWRPGAKSQSAGDANVPNSTPVSDAEPEQIADAAPPPIWNRQSTQTVSPSVRVLAASSILIWAGVLPFTQPEQRLRGRVERSINRGDVSAALALMSAHEETDFPPHWDPPPRIAYRDGGPPMLDLMEQVVADEPAAWVREAYVEKFTRHLRRDRHDFFWFVLRDEESERRRYVDLLLAMPEGAEIIAKAANVDLPENGNLGSPFEDLMKKESPRYEDDDAYRRRVDSFLNEAARIANEQRDGPT